MSSMSQIGFSGVSAAQAALQAASQNTANVNTEGYSRLTLHLGSVAGQGSLDAGGGVEVRHIRRMADEFLLRDLWQKTSDSAEFGSAQATLTALESVMGAEHANIGLGLDQLFSALEATSATPDSIALRQQVIADAGNLAGRFNNQDRQITQQLLSLRQQRSALVDKVNGLAASLAAVNRALVDAQAKGSGAHAVQDQRDTLIAELSGQLQVRVLEQPDGSSNISLANGQPLVVGYRSAQLGIETLAEGEQRLVLDFAGGRLGLHEDNLGGALGGLRTTEYRDLLPTREGLRQMAEGMAQRFNDSLARHFDLKGQPGKPLFSVVAGSGPLIELAALAPDELGFSAVAGEVGNNQGLRELLALKDQALSLNGQQVSLGEGHKSLLGRVATASRDNQANHRVASSDQVDAQARRDGLSAVDLNEEAMNLMTYQQAYASNAKVIQAAREVFDALLAVV